MLNPQKKIDEVWQNLLKLSWNAANRQTAEICQSVGYEESKNSRVLNLLMFCWNDHLPHSPYKHTYIDDATTRWCIPVKKRMVKISVHRTNSGWFIKDCQNVTCWVKGSSNQRAVDITVNMAVSARITASDHCDETQEAFDENFQVKLLQRKTAQTSKYTKKLSKEPSVRFPHSTCPCH